MVETATDNTNRTVANVRSYFTKIGGSLGKTGALDFIFKRVSSFRFEPADLELEFKELAAANQLKPGELMLPLRIMLVGGKFGPHVFDIASIIGKEATISRIKKVLTDLQ